MTHDQVHTAAWEWMKKATEELRDIAKEADKASRVGSLEDAKAMKAVKKQALDGVLAVSKIFGKVVQAAYSYDRTLAASNWFEVGEHEFEWKVKDHTTRTWKGKFKDLPKEPGEVFVKGPAYGHWTHIPQSIIKQALDGAVTAAPKFQDVQKMLLDGLRAAGWTVNEDLRIPHATTRDFNGTRLWFKRQAVYMNDLGTDPRDFKNTHSLSSDIREYKSVQDLIQDVQRMRKIENDSARQRAGL